MTVTLTGSVEWQVFFFSRKCMTLLKTSDLAKFQIIFLTQVSTNGFLTFSTSIDSHHVTQFPSNDFPLIAPLAADFDFRESGSVYYREITQNCTLVPALQIQSLNTDLLDNFQPTMCVIVTWFEANLFSASEDQLVCMYVHM